MKYNIAICGTFNVENYGDVMFPEIFKRAMEKRGLDFDLFLISPGSTCEKTLAPGAKVYSIGELNEIHKKHPLDAIIIGGGALIHYNRISIKLENNDYFSNYNIHDSWYTPIAFAAIHGIKVLFNLPQVPYNFPKSTAKITQNAFNLADYISVRDKKSAEYIKEIFSDHGKNTPEVSVYPDSVCCMSELISGEYLKSIRSDIIDFDGDYAVLQFNPQKPESEDPDLLRAIKLLNKSGMRVLLLPLGYTHNDATVLKEFNNKYGNLCFIIEKKLDIFEMASVLAGCKIYIGASFHGAITAIAYENAAISYNYITPKTKNTEIFKMSNIGDFVADNADDVCKILDGYLNGKLTFKPQINRVISQVNEHFDKIFKLINEKDKNKYSVDDFFAPLIELLPDNAYLENRVDCLTATAEMTDTHVKNLENILNDYKKFNIEKDEKIKELTDSNKKLKERYLEVLGNYETVFNSYNEISNSFFWRLTSPARKMSQKFKNCLSHNKKLLEIAIFAKGFFRHGINGGKTSLSNYRKLAYVNPTASHRFMKLELPKNIIDEQRSYKFNKDITFSILVPLYNTPMDFLEQMIDSVQEHSYQKWELCLADGSDDKHNYVQKYCEKLAKKDKRIKYKKLIENKGISDNTNECINMATGNYIALFDHDDILEHTVLFEYMIAICNKNADFIYCDEDKFNEFGGELYDENYKPDFAVDNLRSNNYICHFTVFDRELLKECGLFRKQFDGSQDHDLILRLTEKAKNIVHIPKILYHWRVSAASVASDPYAKPYTINAGIQAVKEHLNRVGLSGTVESTVMHPNIYRIKYDIIGNPLVSIIIPNYNHVKELSRCIDSIVNRTTYKNYEIIIVENNSDKETFEYYDTLKKYNNIKVVVYKPKDGFNYSAINNYGVRFANGEHYILLNNDVEVITPEWIEEMLMYSQREDVGAVGAMLYYPDDTIQHAGVTIGVLTLAGHNFKHYPRGSCGYFGRAGYQQNVSAVTAACLMVSAQVYDEVGGLEESFAVAFNDIDFCMKIRKAGYLIVFTPFAELYHYESISRGNDETPEKRARFVSEVEQFQNKWAKELKQGDPYYNPNLTLDREDFSPKN